MAKVNWDAAVAVGTFLAVLVALFGDAFKNWIFRPSLKLELPNPRGIIYRVNIFGKRLDDGTRQVRETDSRYYHLKYRMGLDCVGRSCTTYACCCCGSSNLFRRAKVYRHFGSARCRCAGCIRRSIRWRAVGPQALCEYLDVVEAKWINLSTLVGVVGFPLAQRRKGLQNWVLTAQARGLEADSPERRFQLTWNRQWHPGEVEMANNLILRELT